MTHFAYSRRALAPILIAGCSAVVLGGFGCKAGVSASLAGSGGSGNLTGQGGSGGSKGTGGVIITSHRQRRRHRAHRLGRDDRPGRRLHGRPAHAHADPADGLHLGRSLRQRVRQPRRPGSSSTCGQPSSRWSCSCRDKVRFGIASFVGDHGTGSCKLDYKQVAPALNNYDAIKAAYDGWGPLQPYGAKADTPMYAAIPMVKGDAAGRSEHWTEVRHAGDRQRDGLLRRPERALPGGRDHVSDSGSLQPDAQHRDAGGRHPRTSSPNQIEPQVLKNLANAGVGQGVGIPTGSGASTVRTSGTSATVDDHRHGLAEPVHRGGPDWNDLAGELYDGRDRDRVTPTDTSTGSLVSQIPAAIGTIPRAASSTFRASPTQSRSIAPS